MDFRSRDQNSCAESAAQISGRSQSSSQSFATGQTDGRSEVSGFTNGTSETRGSSEALKPIYADLPTAVYSLEEQRHIFTDMVISLPKRTAFAVLAGEGMAKIETLDVPDLIVSDRRKSRVLDGLIAGSGIHKPMKAVHAEITDRFERFMIASRQVDEGPDEPFDPLQNFGDDDDLPEL